MVLNNYLGGEVRNFLVVANHDVYDLKDTLSGQIITTPHESLEGIQKLERDENALIVPGQELSLFCRWEAGRWAVHLLRPGQFGQVSKRLARRLVENHHTELKSTGINSFEADVCAFANAGGGVLYWGVEDNSEVSDGIDWLLDKYGGRDALTCHLRNRLRQNTNTNLFLEVRFDFRVTNGKTILKITIPASIGVVLYKDELYVRAANTTHRLYGDNMIAFICDKMKITRKD